jgi:hypothetical protein
MTRKKIYIFLLAALLTNATTIFAAFCSMYFFKGQTADNVYDTLMLGVFYWFLPSALCQAIQISVYDKLIQVWPVKGKSIENTFKRVIFVWTIFSFCGSILQSEVINTLFTINLYIFAPLMWYLILTPREVLQPQF